MKKPRSITVNNEKYKWRVFRPDGDGDGGLGIKIWRRGVVIYDEFHPYARVPVVTPSLIRNIIENNTRK